jgi:hypothetical protein
MVSTRLKIAAGMLTLLLGGAPVGQILAIDPPNQSRPRAEHAKENAAALSADFDKLRASIKPNPGGYDDIRWMTNLWEARTKAAAEGKPLLVRVGEKGAADEGPTEADLTKLIERLIDLDSIDLAPRVKFRAGLEPSLHTFDADLAARPDRESHRMRKSFLDRS